MTRRSAPLQQTIFLGETRTCTIVNNDRPATLQLTKSIINNDGGAAPATAWTLTANGTTFVTGVRQPVAPGSYVLAESGGPAGYTPGPWTCSGGTLIGNTVTIPATATVSCGITNDDQPAQLTLTKIVVNDNGGSASVANWQLAAGANPVRERCEPEHQSRHLRAHRVRWTGRVQRRARGAAAAASWPAICSPSPSASRLRAASPSTTWWPP